MYILRFILLVILFQTLHLSVQAQGFGSFAGQVRDTDGKPVPFANVLLKGTSIGVAASEKGVFSIGRVPAGDYQAEASAVGFSSVSLPVTIVVGKREFRTFRLKPDTYEMNEVTVTGRSETAEVARQAFQVTAVDAKILHNKTMNIAQALNNVPGVRVRESGGLGSGVDFSLNGFSGNQVKFFIDGVPMDNMGSSFRINNIPINLAERIEVYKGVVPVTLGADALGGAVNIVTKSGSTNFLDASYSIGSFNTHRTSVNLGINSANGFVFQLNAYQNYSKNNYWIESLTPVDEYGSIEKVRARRFHDKYHNEMIMVGVGVRKKKWADQLLFSIDLGKNNTELQNGATMEDVYGERRSKGNIIMPSVKYLKRNLGLKGLDLNVSGNYNLGYENTIDTAFKKYNWLGQMLKDYSYGDPKKKGGERTRMDYKYRNNNGLFSVNLSYRLNEKHSFVINENFSTFHRTGKDLLGESDVFFERPSTLRKNVLGLAYRYDHSEKWNTSLFVKHFMQYSKSFMNVKQAENPTHSDYDWGSNSFTAGGYGIATTYFFKPNFQVRASYEHGVRVPTSSELFGNLNTLTGNISLKPESSENVNVGLIYRPSINNIHFFTFDAGILYRYSKDFIRPSLSRGQAYTVQTMVNLRDVDNKGLEGTVRYRYKNKINAGVNVSYQNLRNQTQFEGGAGDIPSIVYKDRIPNMPYLFGNADASYTVSKLFSQDDYLTVGYQLIYVHQYYEGWPSLGMKSTKNTIPTQWNHSANVMYSFKGGKYNLTLETLNFTDALLYDHFKLQKPSRSFNAKFRYFLFSTK